MVFVRDRMLRNSVMRERWRAFARFATAASAAATAPPPPPWTTFSLAIATWRFLIRRLRRRDSFLCVLAFLRLDDVFLGHVGYEIVFLDSGERHRLGGRNAFRGFDRVDLFAAIDHVRLLAGHSWIGRDRERDAEAFFERPQVGAFVV